MILAMTILAACGSDSASSATSITASSTATTSPTAASTLAPSTTGTLPTLPSDLPPTTEVPPPTLSPTTAPPVTVMPAATEAPPTTSPPATEPSTTEPPTTVSTPGSTVPGAGCAGPTSVPSAATNVTTISGDIDGDTHPDTVTSYSLDGTPHVHATLFTGGNSDIGVPIGFADSVSISFEDIDHSAGAEVPPPVAVLAIGAGNAGSAFAAFLTLTPQYCIAQWSLNGQPYSIRISQQGPYTGLVCDGAAGHIFYSVVEANQQPDTSWLATSSVLTHNFTTAVLNAQPSQTVADNPSIPHDFGDIVNCGHAPLFP